MRAQTSQVFVFILIAVVMGLTILFGYQAITKFTSGSSSVAMNTVQNDLRDSFETIRRLRDTERIHEARVPGRVNRVCFVSDLGFENMAIGTPAHPYLENIPAYEGSGEKVFFLEGGIIVHALDVGNLTIQSTSATNGPYVVSSEEYLCQELTSQLRVRLAGRGDHVEVLLP